jgi:hypothetical protein
MLFSIAEELGMFEPRKNALDHGPRPAHKRLLLESVLKRVKEDPPDSWIEEAEALTFWVGPLAWEFQREKWPATADEEFFEKEWPKFAEAVLAKLSEKESRRGPTQKAKHRTANELAFIFDAFAEPEHENDSQRLRADFVTTALEAVGVRKPVLEKLRYKSTSRLARELPEPSTRAARGQRLYKKIIRAATAKGQSLEVFLTENPRMYVAYCDAVAEKVKKS